MLQFVSACGWHCSSFYFAKGWHFVCRFTVRFCLPCRLRVATNGYVYETFGISKHFPVKLQVLLKRAETLDNALTAKCLYTMLPAGVYSFIKPSTFLLIHFLSNFLLQLFLLDLKEKLLGIHEFHKSLLILLESVESIQSIYRIIFNYFFRVHLKDYLQQYQLFQIFLYQFFIKVFQVWDFLRQGHQTAQNPTIHIFF